MDYEFPCLLDEQRNHEEDPIIYTHEWNQKMTPISDHEYN